MKTIYRIALGTLLPCLWAVMSLWTPTSALAQGLSVYNVNTSNFPQVTADYLLFDAQGNAVTGLTAQDFTVTERNASGQTIDLSPTLTQECVTIDPEASIVLILDRSNSMRDQVNGIPRFTYAKNALKEFVNRIQFTGQTRVALVTFAGNYEVKVDWTNNRQEVFDTLDKMEPLTSTDYRMPFEHPGNNIYEKFRQRPVNVPRYAFFLTDGHPNPAIPDETKFTNDNTDSLLRNAIRFFAVTILVPTTHPTLARMADGTGGKAIVSTENQIVDLFGLLALETQVREACRLSWVSPYACTEGDRSRTATVRVNRTGTQPVELAYTVPPQGIARVTISDPVLFCGDPAANQTSVEEVTITATNTPMTVTGFSFAPTPNPYFSVVDWDFPRNQTAFAPFTLQKGQSRTFRVQFQQGAVQIFRQAILQLAGTPCPQRIDLVGGTGLAILNSPNGGEVFSTCAAVTITWSGVLPTQPVKLEYSEDGGATWKLITASATGFKHNWTPPQAGTRYKIRVSIEPTDQYQWAEALGGTGTETATSLAVSSDNVRVYTTGTFQGPSRFGTQAVTNATDNLDGYLVEWTADGAVANTTLLRGAGSFPDRMVGVLTDDDGNYFIAGDFASQTASLGFLNLTRSTGDASNIFLMKYASDRSVQWTNYGRGDGQNYSTAECTGIRKRVVGGATQIMLVGRFKGFVRLGQKRAGGFEQSAVFRDTRWRNFYCIYDSDGYPTLAAYDATPPAGWTAQALTAQDGNGFTYETGNYTGSRTFSPPAITLAGRGGQDVFLSKYGSIPASSDESENVFTVSRPEISFSVANVTMDPIAVGQKSQKSPGSILCNTGQFPIEISNLQIAGTNPADFSVINRMIGVRLEPGACASLELEFAPSDVGLRTAQIVITEKCGSTTTLQVNGNGLPPCAYDVQSSIIYGTLPQGTTDSKTITCVLKNTGPANLQGTLSAAGSALITVSPLGAFDLAPGACLDLTVDVNASTAGTHAVTLSYGLEAECGSPNTTISVTVVEPNVRMTSVNFGRHRLGTTANDVIRIENLSTEPATITAVTLSDATNTQLTFTLPTPVPFTLAPSATRDIPVVFAPTVRGPHTVVVTAKVQGQATDLTGEATGVGFLPAIVATGYNFPGWTVGQQFPGTGQVTITNSDNDADLFVPSIAFATATADFAWVAAPPTNLTLAPGETQSFDVTFTPQAAGARSVDVVIEHDALEGVVPPYTQTIVQVTGLGTEPSDLLPVEFGDVLSCVSAIKVVTIQNPNPTLPLNCLAPVGSGDVSEIYLSETAAFTIPAGGSRDIIVSFTPSGERLFSARYVIDNDQGLSLNVNVSGTGVSTPADFRFNNSLPAIIGQTVTMPVVVSVADLTGVPMGPVTLTFSYPADAVRFAQLNAPQQAGWTFNTDASVPGTLVVTGTPAPGVVLTSGDFVSPSFNVYLTAKATLDVSFTAQAEPSCVVATGDDGGKITVDEVCFSAGRQIQVGASTFTLGSPLPNPAADDVTIAYSTGIAAPSRFEVIDATGMVVRTITTPVQASGVYELQVSTEGLSSGVYIVRMISGPYTESRRLSVVH